MYRLECLCHFQSLGLWQVMKLWCVCLISSNLSGLCTATMSTNRRQWPVTRTWIPYHYIVIIIPYQYVLGRKQNSKNVFKAWLTHTPDGKVVHRSCLQSQTEKPGVQCISVRLKSNANRHRTDLIGNYGISFVIGFPPKFLYYETRRARYIWRGP